MSPEVILCDEINSALDSAFVEEVLQVVEKLALEGITLMTVTHEMPYATHEMPYAHNVSDRIAFMKGGAYP